MRHELVRAIAREGIALPPHHRDPGNRAYNIVVLGMSRIGLEELLWEAKAAAKKPGPAPKRQQHMDRMRQLPKPQQRFLIQVLESVLAQPGR